MSTHSTIEKNTINKVPIMCIMIIGAFLTTFNQTIMTVALPTLMGEFHILPPTAQWLTTGYMLVNGVLIPITGYFMKRYTTRQLFQTSMFIFLIGSIVCAISTTFPALLAGRLIQAAGAGIIMPLLTNVVLTLFPPHKRGSAMGFVGLAIIFAPAIGPTLAGYVLEHFPWQALFYGMIPFSVLIILSGFVFLKNVSETTHSKVDFISLTLSTVGFGVLLYGFSEAGSHGWSHIEVIVSIIVGLVTIGLFTWRQLSSKNPFLDLRAFKYNMFTLTSIINVGVTIMMFADMILLPLYLQTARGYTPLESGILMLPGALLMGLLSPVVGKLFDRYGAKWLSVIGIIIILFTTFGYTNLTNNTSYLFLILMYTGRRIGMALFLMPIQTAGLNQLPPSLYAHGTAISNTIRQVAGAIGTSLLVTIMTSRKNTHYQSLLSTLDGNGSNDSILMEASIQGINDAYFVILLFGVISLILAFFIKRVEQAPATSLKKSNEN